MKQGIAATALLGLAACTASHAADLGEITLHSRIGEPLRAEIRLQGGGEVDSACFSLASPPANDLPAITDARLKIIRDGNTRRLQISSSQAINEPLFLLAVRGHCGVDLQRDYMLMPTAPEAAYARPAPPAVQTPKAPDWVTSEGESLRSIAEILSPDDASSQRRTLAALRRANPGLNASAALASGTPISIPDLRNLPPDSGPAKAPASKPAPKARPKPAAAEKTRPEARVQEKPAKPEKTEPAAKPADAAVVTPPPKPRPDTSGDRIVLGNAADELPPTPKARENRPGDTPATADGVRDMEERIQRMEETLRALHKEVEQTNKVLELATEALVVQQKLRSAQAEQASLTAQQTPPTQAAPAPTSSREWLELVLAATLGGGLVAALVTVLNRRQYRPMPPAVDRNRLTPPTGEPR